MNQILIISDSHYMPKNTLLKFLNRFQNLRAVVHCGDIYLGYEHGDITLDCPFLICKGNNDFANIPRILQFEIDNRSFVITHGNTYQFAYNPLTLKTLLDDYPADIICFGHTHVPYLHKEKGLMIINPGSLALGRSYPRHNTYALLDLDTLDIHYYDVETNEEITVKNA